MTDSIIHLEAQKHKPTENKVKKFQPLPLRAYGYDHLDSDSDSEQKPAESTKMQLFSPVHIKNPNLWSKERNSYLRFSQYVESYEIWRLQFLTRKQNEEAKENPISNSSSLSKTNKAVYKWINKNDNF